jgi:hypothetical protein
VLHADLPARLPVSATPPDERPELDADRLWEQYKNALDEYRFQVNLNWSRSQYFFVLNVAVLVAGLGLLGATGISLAVDGTVFAIGAVSASISILASQTQHDYFRNSRDLKTSLEEKLGLGPYAIATTTGMGGKRHRLGRLTTFQKAMLGALCLADLTGLGVTVVHATRAQERPAVELATRVVLAGRRDAQMFPLVLSRAGHIAASVSVRPGEVAMLTVRPGHYDADLLAPRLCRTNVTVTTAPLQRLTIHCAATVGKHRP